MMNAIFEKSYQKGWQCPVCKHVFSPTTPMCYFCPGKPKLNFEFEKENEDFSKKPSMFLNEDEKERLKELVL